MPYKPSTATDIIRIRKRTAMFLASPSRGAYMKHLFLRYVMPFVAQGVASHFRQEGRNAADTLGAGTQAAWKKLKPSTIESRKAGGSAPGPILFVTGKIFAFVLNKDKYTVKVNYRAGRIVIAFKKSGQPKYMKYHELGTQPYTIQPKRGMLLRFINGQGHTVYARKVMHPGLPPRPILRLTRSGLTRVQFMLSEVFIGHFNGDPRYLGPTGV